MAAVLELNADSISFLSAPQTPLFNQLQLTFSSRGLCPSTPAESPSPLYAPLSIIMGIPMVQVFLIMARQMSKPVADYFMRYGKDHPIFRNKVLIPVGRSLVQMATRLRMRNLGLGAPTTVAPVSEAAALEQASDLIQQIVIFGYSVGVFAGYYYYQKANEKETVDFKHLDELKSNFDLKIWNLNRRIDDLESKLKSQSLIPSFLTRSQSEPAVPAEPQPIPNAVSSIPFDEALAILKNTPRW